MQNTSMAGVPMNCINWLALGAVVYGAMDKRNALKVLGLKEQINADVLQPLIDRGLSQRKIAEELEVSQSLIRNICKKLGIKQNEVENNEKVMLAVMVLSAVVNGAYASDLVVGPTEPNTTATNSNRL